VIRVALVDNQFATQSRAAEAIARCADIAVIGETDSAASVLERFESDVVVLVDAEEDGRSGFATTRAMFRGRRPTNTIVLSTLDTDALLFGALDAGASAYLLLDREPEELAPAIRSVADTGYFIAPSLVRRVLKEMVRRRDAARSAAAISTREFDVLRGIAAGKPNTQIAVELGLTLGAVKYTVSELLGRKGMSNRTQLLVWAYRAGLVAAPDVAAS
jgi:DNA-binding NarL/FixJ family response regulator